MLTDTAFARTLRRQQTTAESRLWTKLRNRQLAGRKFRRQVPLCGFIVDFAAKDARLVIELDGGQHSIQTIRDEARTCALEAAGFLVLRFWNTDVLTDIGSVVETIHRTLEPDQYK